MMKYCTIISPETPEEIVKSLINLDCRVLTVPQAPNLATPISGHPDMQLFIHGRDLIYNPGISEPTVDQFKEFFNIIPGKRHLKKTNPEDTAYNVAVVGRYAFHKLSYTDPIVENCLKNKNIEIIDVPQGYAQCSTCIVSDNALITADVPIYNEAQKKGLNALLISPGHIELPGYGYGFLGGASGIMEEKVLFTGSLDGHPDKEKIYKFIQAQGKDVYLLSSLPCIDIGTIFVLEI